MTVPNLDCMTETDLMSFWQLHHCGRNRKAAQSLIGDRRKGYTKLAGNLAAYACNKASAMACRLRGDIQTASIYEHHCELLYWELPTDLRW